MRLASWSGSAILLLAGGLLAVLGLAFSPRLLGRGAVEGLAPLSLAILAAGAALVLAGAASIVIAQGRHESARATYGSHATIIGLTLLAALGSFAVALPLLIPAAGARHPSVLGFVASAIVLDVALVSVVYFRVVRPGIITWARMGLAPRTLPDSGRAGLRAVPIVVLGATALATLGALGAALLASLRAEATPDPPALGLALLALGLDVVLITVLYLRVVRPALGTLRQSGLLPLNLPHVVLIGFGAWPMLFLLIAVVEVVLRALGVRQTQLESLEWLRRIAPWQFALVAFTTAVLAPIAEEIYFRGFVFRAYLEQKGPAQAYLFSSVLFALVHLNLPAVLPIFVVGLLLAALYHRTGSVLPGIIAHACNNAMAFAVLYFAPLPGAGP